MKLKISNFGHNSKRIDYSKKNEDFSFFNHSLVNIHQESFDRFYKKKSF